MAATVRRTRQMMAGREQGLFWDPDPIRSRCCGNRCRIRFERPFPGRGSDRDAHARADRDRDRCFNPHGLAGALSRFFWITRVSGLSKYATDDQDQKDQRSGQEQSGNNLFTQRNAAPSGRFARLTAQIVFGGPQFLLRGVDDGEEQPIARASTAGSRK